jgi:drug/metabolite transporter (DMT)-like permease
MRDRALAANAALVVAAVIFGASVVATRAAVRDVPPLSLAVLRYGLGSGALFLCLAVGAPHLLRASRRDLPYLALLGALLFAAFPLTLNAGLRLTEASRGALMIATAPFWSALLARRAGQERLATRQVAGLALTFTGVAVALAEHGLAWRGGGQALAGDGLLLLTALCGAAYNVLAKPAYARHAALTITAYSMLAGTLLLLPAALAEGLLPAMAGLGGRAMALVLFLGLPGGALGWYLWSFALGRLTPTQTVVYVNLNPLTALALGTALLGEHVTPALLVAFMVSLTGIALVNWPTPHRAAANSAPVRAVPDCP